eukprot:SAG31_NODE_46_length_30980_cov_226.095107_18_plen_175_part_00
MQRPVAELKVLRKSAIQSQYRPGRDTPLAHGSQIEILVQCKMPIVPPPSGVVAIHTLKTSNGSQSLQVGYEFGVRNATTGFATLAPAIARGMRNFNRTDRAPVQAAVIPGGVLEPNVFVDGDRAEKFFGGVATITSVTGNVVPSRSLSSSFVNTAGLEHCTVNSWALHGTGVRV